jgi:hypothetical protein
VGEKGRTALQVVIGASLGLANTHMPHRYQQIVDVIARMTRPPDDVKKRIRQRDPNTIFQSCIM